MSTGESMTSPTSDASGHHRRDRAAIAAQACETCRTRKSKCDEKRPQCSLCKRLGVHCEYREPVPTKKDKTLVEILDSLQRMELKLDRLNSTDPTSSTSSQMDPAAAISSRGLSTVAGTPAGIDAGSKYATEAFIEPKPNRHVTAPHKVLLWPAIWTLLINSGHPVAQDVQRISQEGTPWILKLDMLKHQSTLPVNVSLESKDGPKYGVDSTIERRVLFPTLTQELMERYAVYYFDSYNVLYPLLDKEDFQRQHFWKVVQNGYGDGDISSVLCLLVFALGKVAEDGLYGRPLNRSDGQPSGLRGGSIQFPPGLDIFNEARRRLGFVALECTLESIQALMLTAVYYESCGRHLDFWRFAVSASMGCQVLIRCNAPIQWDSHVGDVISRNFWTCTLIENWYHLDLDLPQTGISSLESEVPLPRFVRQDITATPHRDERSLIEYPFLAMIAIRRLTSNIHAVIFDSASSAAEKLEENCGPPLHIIAELARQLDNWRSLLPQPLQWTDDEKLAFSGIEHGGFQSEGAYYHQSPDSGFGDTQYRLNLDINTAQLRTRFYYARFMIYRPFVFKALHSPTLVTTDDVDRIVICMESALHWPIIMAPPKTKKRLVPYLFAWTQNLVGILLILRMTKENNLLKRICDEKIPRDKLDETASMMLEWIRDVKQLDGAAEWSWGFLEPLYANFSLTSHLN